LNEGGKFADPYAIPSVFDPSLSANIGAAATMTDRTKSDGSHHYHTKQSTNRQQRSISPHFCPLWTIPSAFAFCSPHDENDEDTSVLTSPSGRRIMNSGIDCSNTMPGIHFSSDSEDDNSDENVEQVPDDPLIINKSSGSVDEKTATMTQNDSALFQPTSATPTTTTSPSATPTITTKLRTVTNTATGQIGAMQIQNNAPVYQASSKGRIIADSSHIFCPPRAPRCEWTLNAIRLWRR
jgi:hypothetical protein